MTFFVKKYLCNVTYVYRPSQTMQLGPCVLHCRLIFSWAEAVFCFYKRPSPFKTQRAASSYRTRLCLSRKANTRFMWKTGSIVSWIPARTNLHHVSMVKYEVLCYDKALKRFEYFQNCEAPLSIATIKTIYCNIEGTEGDSKLLFAVSAFDSDSVVGVSKTPSKICGEKHVNVMTDLIIMFILQYEPLKTSSRKLDWLLTFGNCCRSALRFPSAKQTISIFQET